MYSFDEVLNYDPEVAKAMEDELTRQRTHIELIASAIVTFSRITLCIFIRKRASHSCHNGLTYKVF